MASIGCRAEARQSPRTQNTFRDINSKYTQLEKYSKRTGTRKDRKETTAECSKRRLDEVMFLTHNTGPAGEQTTTGRSNTLVLLDLPKSRGNTISRRRTS